MRKTYLIIAAVLLAILGGILFIRYRLYTSGEQARQTRIAVVMNGSREDRSYSQSYYRAMVSYQEKYGTDVVFHDNISADMFEPLVEELIAKGYWIIIGDTYEYEPACQKLSPEYPDVYFLNATGTLYSYNYTSFLGRVYQARYLSGIVAGKRTATNEIGYVIAMPTPETIRQVNAFTLGVRKANPAATVYVRFTNDWNDDATATAVTEALLDDHNIDVLSLQTNTIAPLRVADARGVYTIGNNFDNRELFPETYLTATVFQWEDFLTARISECERGKFIGRHYWESIRTGMVTLAPLTENVYFMTGDAVEQEKQKILAGTYDVFYGPVYDNSGVLRVREGENLPDDELLYRMFWYVDGVVTE